MKGLVVSGLIALVASCGFPSLPRLDHEDAGRDGATDSAGGPIDAALDAALDAPTDAGCGTGQTMCTSGCADLKTDDDNCGACEVMCAGGTTCHAPATGTMGKCCAANETNCNGVCIDTSTNEANCGACAGAGGASCSGANDTCCGGSCVDTTTNGANCGGCAGAGGTVCSAANSTCCNSECVDTMTDEANCGGCAGAGGTACIGGGNSCCSGSCVDTSSSKANCGGCGTEFACTGTDLCCGSSCTDVVTQSDCGACGNVCSGGDTCMAAAGSGQPDCCASNELNCSGTCVDISVSNTNCGSCGNVCNAATESCTPPESGGVSSCCPSGTINCDGVCRDLLTDNAACGSCTSGCVGGDTCSGGHCCAPGLSWCASENACVNLTEDEANCGGCGRTCGAGLCQSGQCECEFAMTDACSAGTCKVTSIDPDACGVACADCAGTDVCVSGGCRATCPPPLTNCAGEPDDLYTFRRCVNTDADNQNCGSCGADCATGTGCSGGTCVPLVIDPPVTPAKCIPAGPAISVPMTTNGGTPTCTGKLASVSFLFGLCSRTSIGPLSTTLTTDAFDSTFAPHVSSCTLDSHCSGGNKRCRLTKTICTTIANCSGGASDTCDFPIKCVASTCAGGSVGVNGRNSAGSMVGPLFSNTQTTTIGGDFWAFGTVGLAIKGDTTVKQRLFNGTPADLNASNGPFDFSKSTRVYGDANIKGPFTVTGGAASVTIDGALTTATACGSLPPELTSGSCTVGGFPTLKEPCGDYNNTDGSLLPITELIVPWFRETANNDNALIGLKPNAFENPTGPLHLDLHCGVYYLSSINAAHALTIAVHGRTVLVVGGAITGSDELIIDVDPTATLDIFVGGVLDLDNAATIGSPAYPRLTRLYVGSSSCSGGGGSCNEVSDCCSGGCTACPTTADGTSTGPCSGPGICTGGSNKSQAFSPSFGSFNGLFWAGYGTFSISNPLDMSGAIYANYYDAAAATMIHYDNGAALLGAECTPIATGQACQSCRNCNGQACVGNVCSACTADTECCAPLRCVGGSCTF